MTLTLRIRNMDRLDNGVPTEFLLNNRGAIIGRAATCDWSLPDPRNYISSRHGEIMFRDGFYFFNDISTNGTFLNGGANRMAEPRRIESGDIFLIGHYEVEAGLSGAASAAAERQEQQAQDQARQAGGFSWDSGTPPPPAPAAPGGWGETPPPPNAGLGSGAGGMAAPSGGGWGAPPAPPHPPAGGGWGAPPPPAPPPPASDGWAPAPPPPPADNWGARPAPPAPPPASDGWGAPPTPPAGGSDWSAPPPPPPAPPPPPPPAPPPPPNGDWGAPAAAPPAPSWAAAPPPPPPSGNWAPPPAPPPPPPPPRAAEAPPAAGWDAPKAPVQQASAWSSPVEGPKAASPEKVWGSMEESNVVDWSRAFGDQGGDAKALLALDKKPVDALAKAAPAAAAGGTSAAPEAAPAAVAAEPAAPDMGEVAVAFGKACGLKPEQIKEPSAETIERAANVMRRLVSGLVVMVEARARAKSQMGAEQTGLEFDGNNPIKFARTPDQALAQLLNPPERGFMASEKAVEDAYFDLQSHQMATLKAMQGALRATLDRFSPAAIKRRAESGGFLARIMPGGRDSTLWQTYEREFSGVSQGSDEAFMDVFAKEFRLAYEELNRNRNK